MSSFSGLGTPNNKPTQAAAAAAAAAVDSAAGCREWRQPGCMCASVVLTNK